jgi:hypothetical protein
MKYFLASYVMTKKGKIIEYSRETTKTEHDR